MSVAELKREVQERDRRIAELEETVREQAERIAELERERAELRATLSRRAETNASKKPRFSGDYSLAFQERQSSGRRKRKRSPGRRRKSEKLKQVVRTEDVYPDGVPPERCCLVRDRVVWRLEDGRAVLVRYRLYKETWTNNVARLPDVMPRGEYGLEVAVTLAYLVYVIGVSLDQARALLEFFTHLELSKSQGDALLNQLGRLWNEEFEALVELMALATVVYMDETGWKVSAQRCYAWVFTSLLHTVVLYGKSREGSVLDEILPPDVFTGTAVSDDYAVYRQRFSRGQKCWAHLLRKAIKLMLAHPQKPEYGELLQDLLALFREGKRAQQDRRLGEAGRRRRVGQLEETLQALCMRFRPAVEEDSPEDVRELARLLKELVRCMTDGELFTFVLDPQVEPTNNRSERTLRTDAQARNNYRTSKTDQGAHRRSVIQSVLLSLRQNLERFTLQRVLDEVSEWVRCGVSRFRRQLQELQHRFNTDRASPSPSPDAA